MSTQWKLERAKEALAKAQKEVGLGVRRRGRGCSRMWYNRGS